MGSLRQSCKIGEGLESFVLLALLSSLWYYRPAGWGRLLELFSQVGPCSGLYL